VGFGKLGSIKQSAKIIRPDISVVLSVFLEHRSELKSLETAAREKQELLNCLPENGVAVLNSDDQLVAKMPVPPGCKLIRVVRLPSGASKGGQIAERALAFADYLATAEFLKPVLGPGDVVLLKAGRNNQLPRLFYSLLGEVRCTIPSCRLPMVCDDCPGFRNPKLVQWANEQLTVKAD
jgi:UDP-N-acetylmuramyl pentapeptide synthase